MRSRRIPVTVFLGVVIVLGVIAVRSQTRVNQSGTGGIHSIQGRIYLPNGRSLDSPLSVELQSNNYLPLSVQTDPNGSFAFRNLAPGNYSIVVNAGENFEIATERIMIDTEIQGPVRVRPTPKTFTVPIYLQLKTSAPSKTGVIDAKLASLPKDALRHYERGMELRASDETDDAIREFKQAISVYLQFTQCHVELGKAYLKTNQLPEAVKSLQTAIGIEPANFDARLHLGVALMNERQFDDAEKELVTAAYLNRQAVTPHYYLGVMYIEKKNLDIAQKALETAKELKGSKSFPLLHKYLGGVYMAKNLNTKAADELEAYLKQDPNAKDADRVKATISELKKKN